MIEFKYKDCAVIVEADCVTLDGITIYNGITTDINMGELVALLDAAVKVEANNSKTWTVAHADVDGLSRIAKFSGYTVADVTYDIMINKGGLKAHLIKSGIRKVYLLDAEGIARFKLNLLNGISRVLDRI